MILIVEDDPLVRALVVDFCLHAGSVAPEAADAREALPILRNRPDVSAALTDVEMPGSMTGLVLAGYIRATWPTILVMIASGNVRPERATLPVGADFFTRPFDPGIIVDRVSTVTRGVAREMEWSNTRSGQSDRSSGNPARICTGPGGLPSGSWP